MEPADGLIPHTCTLEFDIHAALQPSLPAAFSGLRVNASFRYVLWNGTRVATDALGGSGWEVLQPPAARPSSAAGAPVATPVGKGGAPAAAASVDKGKGSAKDGGGSAAGGGGAAAAARGCLLRHRTSVSGLVADAATALRLGARPVLYLFCALRVEDASEPAAPAAGGKAAAAPPAKSAPVAPAAAAGSPRPAHRPYAFFLPLDLSPLLLPGEAAVSVVHGSAAAGAVALGLGGGGGSGGAPAAAAGEEGAFDLASFLGLSSAPAPPLPPPSLFSFLAFTARVASATLPPPAGAPALAAAAAAAPLPEASLTPAGKGGKAAPTPAAKSVAPAPPAPPPPMPVHPPTLLSPAVRVAVNPLAVTLLRAQSLPGAGCGENGDAYAAQRAHCRRTYALIVPPRFEGAGGNESAQVVRLADAPSGDSVGGGSSGAPVAAASCLRAPSALQEVRLGLTVAYPPLHVAFTPALPHGPDAAWARTTVFCLGGGPAPPVREALQTRPLEVRVHDRDCPAFEAVQECARASMESSRQAVEEAAEKAAAAAEAVRAAEAATAASAAAATAAAPAKGGKGAPAPAPAAAKGGGAPAPGTEAAAAAPRAPAGPPLPQLLAALLPVDWPWPVLPAPRCAFFESISGPEGGALWPAASGGGPLASCVPPPPPGAAAPAPAPAASPPPAKAPPPAAKGKDAPAAAATAAPPPPAFVPDAFDVDSLFIAELCARLLGAADAHAHATAALRLEGLLNDATPSLSLSVPLQPAQRRARPLGSEPAYLLTRAAAATTTPGAYFAAGARLKVAVSLGAPLGAAATPAGALSSTGAAAALLGASLRAGGAEWDTAFAGGGDARAPPPMRAAEAGPFERLVLLCPYDADDITLRVVRVVTSVNTAVLPPHAPSLRTYVLSPGELAALESGGADAITGVHVTDGVQRLFILEGLAPGGGGGGGMGALRLALPPHDDPAALGTVLLANPAVRFQTRLFARAGLALRGLRLRAPFAAAAAAPAVFDRKLSSPALEGALCALAALAERRVGTLALARELGDGVWPSFEGLAELDTKCGDALSLRDVYGALHPAAAALAETRARLAQAERLVDGQRPAATDAARLLEATLRGGGGCDLPRFGDGEATAGALASMRIHAYRLDHTAMPTLMAPGVVLRRSRDFFAENAAAVAAASGTVGAARLAAAEGAGRAGGVSREEFRAGLTLDTLGRIPPGGQVFLYSSQALNTGDWARRLQRERLGGERGAVFVRSASPELNALASPLDLDAAEEARAEAAASRAAWLTRRGFTYPTGKTREEDLAHPKADSVSAFLVEPYAEELGKRAVDAAETRRAGEMSGRPPFRPRCFLWPLGEGDLGYRDPLTGKGTFGFRDGASNANTSSEFFKSVFLQGAEARREAEAAQRAAEAHWASKVVTDTQHFKHHQPRDGTRGERHLTLLRDAPARPALRAVVLGAPASPKGGVRLAPLEPLPPSMMATEPFPGPPPPLPDMLRALPRAPPGSPGGAAARAFEATFLAKDAATGAPRDFKRVADKDIIRGVAAVTHKPLLTAGRSVHATPGARTLPLLPAHRFGVNTDHPF
jgi:hypothetical protein